MPDDKPTEPTIEERLAALEQNMVQLRAMLHDYEHMKLFVLTVKKEREVAIQNMEAAKTKQILKNSKARLRMHGP